MSSFTFLDLAGFRARTIMPSPDVDQLEAQEPGWILLQLIDRSDFIVARLTRRYGPWVAPYPFTVLRWLEALVTADVYLKRGGNPSDAQFLNLTETRPAKAEAEILAAANSETGLTELPIRSDSTASGVTKGGPLVYSEASPYTWTDVQAEAVRNG